LFIPAIFWGWSFSVCIWISWLCHCISNLFAVFYLKFFHPNRTKNKETRAKNKKTYNF
jgi:hypothetical protein